MQKGSSSSEAIEMKTTLFGLCLLCSTAALGQAVGGGAISSQPTITEFNSHTARATQQPLGTEQDLWGSSPYGYGQGERPLWEVAPPLTSPSLGDVARTFRKEHETLKKAEVVWTN
jgi:hypothetical protein